MVLLSSHQLIQHYFKYPLPFLDHYLDPFIFGAIVPYFIKWEQRLLWNKGRHYVLPDWLIISLFIFLSLLSEVILPYFHSGYTQDIYDILAIGIGVLFYKALLNNKA